MDRTTPASHWVKSSLSFANGNCVEVAGLPDGEIGVRNSREPDGPVLRFTSDEWNAFLGGVRLGEFDRFGSPSTPGSQQLTPCHPACGNGYQPDEAIRGQQR